MNILDMMEFVVTEDASDLHLVVGEPPTVRLHGRLVNVPGYEVLTPELTLDLCKQIIPERSWNELQTELGADFGFAYGDKARFRCATYFQKHSIAIVLRQIPNRLLTFEQIGLSDHVKQLCYEPRGLILVVGPTGSGKTTTLATMIDFINVNRDTNIITVEDPIEYYHDHKKSSVSQREVGVDVHTFDTGVVKAMRQDPDVILVGEMRGLDTIEAAVRAAETGHLVFSTLHTTGAARTVDRVVDVFPVNQQEQIRTQLAGNLKAVISQILIPKKGGKGRVAAFEIMLNTTAIAANIRDRKTASITSSIQTGTQLGMKTLDMSLVDLYKRDLIERSELFRLAQDIEDVKEKIGERTVGDDAQVGRGQTAHQQQQQHRGAHPPRR